MKILAKAKALMLFGIVVVIGAALAGCAGGSGDAADASVSFEVYAGEQIDAEGIALLGEGPMPAEGWAVADGTLQVQLIGGSVPGITVADVQVSADGEATVTLEATDGPSTMDIAFFEVMASIGEREVSSVMLDRGDGAGPVALERLG